ncbi:PD-(D/E)XK nuclease family protein [Hellea sp.]|nr:PD-(D/E)XK nuclease family protein [Hellea sp.]
MSKPTVYNMPSGVPFLPSLARGLREIHGEHLNDALILLPTRRAVRALGEAFVGDTGASLLPRMRPLADINPEEPPFEPGELVGLIKPAIDPMQRRFEMGRLIFHYHQAISDLPLDPAGALALADPLIAILDDAAMEEADISRITDLKEIQDFAAEHFKYAITLYEIVQDYWPSRLSESELDLMEPMQRRVALLKALTDIWQETPPKYPVIVAGSTGTLGASAQLMKTVAHMKDGMIILPGLNNNVPDKAWKDVGPQHPQNSLKNLIETIGIERGDVTNWRHIDGHNPSHLDARRRVIAESLVPIQATGDWPSRIAALKQGAPKGTEPFKDALQGLSVIEADNDEEEALAIALILRESLEDDEAAQTAALVTPDPALARRVKSRLRRWGVEVDYSQGEPLEETSLGAFLTAILDVSQNPESAHAVSVLCKHPMLSAGQKHGDLKRDWVRHEHRMRADREPPTLSQFSGFELLASQIKPLAELEEASASIWAQALTSAAEGLAATDEAEGAARLWVEDAGEKAASLIEGLMAHGDNLPDMSLEDFAKLFGSLMRGKVVRPRYGTDPRLAILGPLEARMLSYDKVILGGLNEGIWPAPPSIEPFLSRGMRKTLGLSLPERRFGLSAHDFAELAANPDVVLTRSKRSDDGPKVASRWLWRLQTLMTGALGEKEATAGLSQGQKYLNWARAMDYVAPKDVVTATRPEPTPPAEARWPNEKRKLSVTQIKTWIRDPYSIYARHVLGLNPLGDLDAPLDVRDFGQAIHKGLEDFANDHKTTLPKNAADKLVATFKAAMAHYKCPDYDIEKEVPRLEKVAAQIVEWMAGRRAAGWAFRQAEARINYHFDAENFTITGVADLIEKGPSGYAVTDYKTGAPSTLKVVQAGFDPQLPLTAYILAQGGVKGQGADDVEQLNYVRVKGSGDSHDLVSSLTEGDKGWPASDYSAEAYKTLAALIRSFDDPATIYHSQPRAQYTHDYGDYDHLARRDEWARLGAERKSGGSDD